MSINTRLVQFSGSWHQDVAHKGFEAGPQSLLVGHNQKVFSGIFLDLARKLDAVDLGGHTLLDDTLIAWTQECVAATHESYNVPIVTMGSADGAIKTGKHCDYRYMNPKSEYPYVKSKGLYPGLPWNQHLGGVLVARGLPRSEFETASMKGYGHPSVDGSQRAAMSPGSVEGGQVAAVYCGVNGDTPRVKRYVVAPSSGTGFLVGLRVKSESCATGDGALAVGPEVVNHRGAQADSVLADRLGSL